jgi:hypothetical protein
MKIASHEITQTGSHLFSRKEWEQETTYAWVGDDPRAALSEETVSSPFAGNHLDQDTLRISHDAYLRFQTVSAPQQECVEETTEMMEDPRLRTMRRILEMLTGKKVEVAEFSATDPAAPPQPLSSAHSAEVNERVGWGLEYDYVKGEHESERLEYTATGSVVLEDGQELTFNLSMLMARDYTSTTEVHIRAGDARLVDPLVINLNGQGVSLADMKFSFDLDADGVPDSISVLAPGHGFLAVDWNEDGLINDGTELFGPESGNGFQELSQYDTDGNGWLDENDPLYEKLMVWSRDQAGNNELISLSQAGVGALFLDGQEGLFSLSDQQNDQHGLVRETSFFLREHGGAGTIQEVDFVV